MTWRDVTEDEASLVNVKLTCVTHHRDSLCVGLRHRITSLAGLPRARRGFERGDIFVQLKFFVFISCSGQMRPPSRVKAPLTYDS